MVHKLNVFLWLVVLLYLLYAIIIEGFTTKLMGLSVLAILTLIAQIVDWQRKKKQKDKKKHQNS